LISNFRRVLNVVRFFSGDSPAYEFYMQTFRNNLSVPSSTRIYLPMKMEQSVPKRRHINSDVGESPKRKHTKVYSLS